ncbi:hypothetical protein [Rhizobium subbaraonis]|uniref:hypothetical protein n=1 Tax=Rhizobium subbaraonis TaxID=908946 RepID=UPI001FDF4BAE|nr:hypothetical protein [Rhizobium subbaraonis]
MAVTFVNSASIVVSFAGREIRQAAVSIQSQLRNGSQELKQNNDLLGKEHSHGKGNRNHRDRNDLPPQHPGRGIRRSRNRRRSRRSPIPRKGG